MNAYIIWLLLNAESDQNLKKQWNFIIQLAEELLVYEENVAGPTWVSDVLHTNTYINPQEKNQDIMFII